jgi:hypothetical protein
MILPHKYKVLPSNSIFKPRVRIWTYLGLAVAFTTPGSGDRIMLTSLSQFQAQGWEKRLSWISFAWKDRLSKIRSDKT